MLSESAATYVQYILFLGIVLTLVKPTGTYMARVFSGERTALTPIIFPIERMVYRLGGIDPEAEQTWGEYAKAFLWFSFATVIALYVILRLQNHLPTFDPATMTTPMTPDLAANTAVSFSTTATWQAFGGESTLSPVAQMIGLCTNSFVGGAAGLAIGIAFMRGLARTRSNTLGNFWVDLTRGLLYVLLPIALIAGIVLLALGVPISLRSHVDATTIEGAKQVIALGPVAPLQVIENLGTNGGGYFNVNAAHPFQTPSGLVNIINMLLIVVLPAALTHTFGLLTGRVKDARTLLWVMVLLFVVGLVVADHAERSGPTYEQTLHLRGGNMEGKEVRFGITGSALNSVTTSNTATGSTNSMPDSYTPIGGLVPLANMLLGEIIFGGLGTGIYSIVIIAMLGLFLCGLMIGRTPEYLGKRIKERETQFVMLYVLAQPLAVLLLAALAVSTAAGRAGLTTNTGAHGFTEVLFAYTSCFANNGQSFAGLSANSPFYNVTTLVAIMAGRFFLAVPALALAGCLARQLRTAQTLGTFPTDGALFGGVVIATAILVVLLSCFAPLALGPIVEHLQMLRNALH